MPGIGIPFEGSLFLLAILVVLMIFGAALDIE